MEIDISCFKKEDLNDSDFILVRFPTSKYPKGEIIDVFRKIQNSLELNKKIVFIPKDVDVEPVNKAYIQDMISRLQSLL